MSTGPFSRILQLLEDQLVDCTDLTDELGVDLTEWRAGIHWYANEDYVRNEGVVDRPFVVIASEDLTGRETGVTGNCHTLRYDGGILMSLERDAAAGTMKESYQDFKNWVGEIISHIKATNGTEPTNGTGAVVWREIEVVAPAERVDVRFRDAPHDFWTIGFKLSY